MNCKKVGALIRSLRQDQALTQKQLADQLHLSDRTISKWERGLGCPDVSLLGALSARLGVSLPQLLSGELAVCPQNGGNMKRIQFYVCPTCGTILTSTGTGEICCCGRPLTPLAPKPADVAHTVHLEPMEDEWYLTFSHPMEKGHFVSFIAYATIHQLLLVRLYPEQDGALRIPQMRGGVLYLYCGQHGLFIQPQ